MNRQRRNRCNRNKMQ